MADADREPDPSRPLDDQERTTLRGLEQRLRPRGRALTTGLVLLAAILLAPVAVFVAVVVAVFVSGPALVACGVLAAMALASLVVFDLTSAHTTEPPRNRGQR